MIDSERVKEILFGLGADLPQELCVVILMYLTQEREILLHPKWTQIPADALCHFSKACGTGSGIRHDRETFSAYYTRIRKYGLVRSRIV